MAITSRFITALAATSVLAMAALGATTAPGAAGYKILMISKMQGNAYFAAAESGATEAAKELGDDLILNSPANATPTEQSRIIQSGIAQKVDGIILSAMDPNAVVPDMQQAQSEGVKTITYDADIAVPGRSLMAMQATNEGIGRSLPQVICNVVPKCSGEIAILSSDPNSPNLSVWVKWAQEELKGDKYANLKLVDIAYGGETAAGAYTRTQELLKAHPNLAGLIVPGSVQVAAAARAVKDEGASGKIQLTGLGLPSELKAYVADGTIKQFVLWNPSDLGYLAVNMIHQLIAKTLKTDPGTEFVAGKLGKFTVGADGVVLLGPPLVIDAKNIGSLHF